MNGGAAIEKIDDKPELWILDIMLPDTDGYEIIRKIKEKDSKIPVIFMSARNAGQRYFIHYAWDRSSIYCYRLRYCKARCKLYSKAFKGARRIYCKDST